MRFEIGIVRTKGRKFIDLTRYENGFDFVLNLIPKKFGFYLWVIVDKKVPKVPFSAKGVDTKNPSNFKDLSRNNAKCQKCQHICFL